jgi:hypothetical protein
MVLPVLSCRRFFRPAAVAVVVVVWGLVGCSGGGGSVGAFCSEARGQASALSGSSLSAKAGALARLRGVAPGEIALSLRALLDAFNLDAPLNRG